MKKTTKGFTMVELIIVIAVLALLAVGAVLAFQGVQRNARVTTNRTAAQNLVDQMNMFIQAGGAAAGIDTPANGVFTMVIPASGILDVQDYSVVFESQTRAAQVRTFINNTGPNGMWIVTATAAQLDVQPL